MEGREFYEVFENEKVLWKKKRLRNGRENEKIRGNNSDKKETKKRRKFMISWKNILINLKNVSYKCHDLHVN